MPLYIFKTFLEEITNFLEIFLEVVFLDAVLPDIFFGTTFFFTEFFVVVFMFTAVDIDLFYHTGQERPATHLQYVLM